MSETTQRALAFNNNLLAKGDGPIITAKNSFGLDAVLHLTVSTSSKHYVIPIQLEKRPLSQFSKKPTAIVYFEIG